MDPAQDLDNPRRSQRKRKAVSYVGNDDESATSDDRADAPYEPRELLLSAQKRRKRTGTMQRQDTAAPFRFFDLPGELRNLIYRAFLASVVSAHDPASIHVQFSPKIKRPVFSQVVSSRSQRLGVLRVNKQMHEETINIIYSHAISFPRFEPLCQFLMDIGSKNRARLEHVIVEQFGFKTGADYLTRGTFYLLADAAPSLKRLELRFDSDINTDTTFIFRPNLPSVAMGFHVVARPFLDALYRCHGAEGSMARLHIVYNVLFTRQFKTIDDSTDFYNTTLTLLNARSPLALI